MKRVYFSLPMTIVSLFLFTNLMHIRVITICTLASQPLTLRGLHAFALLKPYLTGYQKRTGQFLRALHAYSIDNFVFF